MHKSKQPAYILRVSGYAQLDALREVFGEKHRARIEEVLAGYQRHIQQRGFARHGAYALLTVQDVKYEETQTEVYSLETSTGTLIAASGLICHNCFPKDVLALAHMAKERGRHPQLIQAVMDINSDRRRQAVDKLRELVGGSLEAKKIGILGLAFKPNTDDMRDAPALEVIDLIEAEGGRVQAYDPVAMQVARQLRPNLELTVNPYECGAGCDAVVLMTEWNEFKQLDLRRLKNLMKSPVIIDARNIYEPEQLADMGFSYRGIGRGYNYR